MEKHLQWRKSSYSDTSCVEMAAEAKTVAIRNSNHPDAGTLHVPRPAMAGLLASVKAGEFNDLA
jgi:hypothetical protein